VPLYFRKTGRTGCRIKLGWSPGRAAKVLERQNNLRRLPGLIYFLFPTGAPVCPGRFVTDQSDSKLPQKLQQAALECASLLAL